MRRKICFIINPVSGSGRGRLLPDLIRAIEISKNSENHFIFTEGPGHGIELAQRASESEYDTVVACGGDGTVNEVAKGLRESNCSMGIIPYGSGNGLARHYSIPFNLNKALDTIVNGTQIWHDGALINGHQAFNVSGIGFDAHVAALFGKNGKRGFNNYLKLIAGEFNSYPESEVEIMFDDHIITCNSMMISIAIASQFGNNACIAPYADTADNLTDITVVKKMPWIQVLPFALRVFGKKIEGSAYACLYKSSKFIIKSKNSLPLHIDGEPKGNSHLFEIISVPKAILLHIPSQYVQQK